MTIRYDIDLNANQTVQGKWKVRLASRRGRDELRELLRKGIPVEGIVILPVDYEDKRSKYGLLVLLLASKDDMAESERMEKTAEAQALSVVLGRNFAQSLGYAEKLCQFARYTEDDGIPEELKLSARYLGKDVEKDLEIVRRLLREQDLARA